MTVDGAFPMPIQVSSHDLVKRKHDWLSDNLPFNDTVSIFIISCNSNKFYNHLITGRWMSYLHGRIEIHKNSQNGSERPPIVDKVSGK